MKVIIFVFPVLALLRWPALALDTARIDEITGLKGLFNEEEKVFKVTSPRGDLGITVDDWKMPATSSSTAGAVEKPHRWRKRSMPHSPSSKPPSR